MAAAQPYLTALGGRCAGQWWPQGLPGYVVRLHGPLAKLCSRCVSTLSLADHVPDPSHTLEAPLAELREDFSFEVQPVKILDR